MGIVLAINNTNTSQEVDVVETPFYVNCLLSKQTLSITTG